MKNSERIIYFAAIIVLAFLLGKGCGKPVTTEVTTRDTSYVYKTDTIKETHNFFTEKTVEKIVHDTMTVEDSSAVVDDYFTKKVVQDSLVTKDLWVRVTDTIGKNSLLSRTWESKILMPQQIIINNTTVYKPTLYIGAFISAGLKDSSLAGGYGLRADFFKNNISYSGGYDFKRKEVVVGANIKIK